MGAPKVIHYILSRSDDPDKTVTVNVTQAPTVKSVAYAFYNAKEALDEALDGTTSIRHHRC